MKLFPEYRGFLVNTMRCSGRNSGICKQNYVGGEHILNISSKVFFPEKPGMLLKNFSWYFRGLAHGKYPLSTWQGLGSGLTEVEPWAGFYNNNTRFIIHKTASLTGSISNEIICNTHRALQMTHDKWFGWQAKKCHFSRAQSPQNPSLATTWPKELQHFRVPGEMKFSSSAPKHNSCADIKQPAE